MLKNFKPIILIAGDPKSVFLEIFFKSLKKNKFKNPLILIVNENILLEQMKALKFNFETNKLDIGHINYKNLNNKKINFINVSFNKKLISNYIDQSFEIALFLIKNNNKMNLINGPINKKTFLNKKFFGITEYVSSNFNKKRIGMLIYNKDLSVCPLTTHLPIKLISKKILKFKL